VKYLLDTSIVIELLRPRNRVTLLARIEACAPGEVMTSAVWRMSSPMVPPTAAARTRAGGG
jgi:predicted nucleic acid-binding protein